MKDLSTSGELRDRDFLAVFRLVDFWYKASPTTNVFYIYQRKDTSVEVRDIILHLHTLEAQFPEHIQIKNFVNLDDYVGDGYWGNMRVLGDRKKMPIAEVEVRKPLEKIAAKIERKYKYLSEVEKIEVIVSESKGIFKANTPNRIYEMRLSKGRGRYDLIRYLFDIKKVSGQKELAGRFKRKTADIRNDVREINELCSLRAGFIEKLIIKVPTGGYLLNSEKYDLNFLP